LLVFIPWPGLLVDFVPLKEWKLNVINGPHNEVSKDNPESVPHNCCDNVDLPKIPLIILNDLQCFWIVGLAYLGSKVKEEESNQES
jgi:hypothetical protein